MQDGVQKICLDWTAYACGGPENAPEEVFVNGWLLVDLVQDAPAVAFDAIRAIIGQYAEADYYSVDKTEAQRVVGLLAAGPLEDLLGAHGEIFIDRLEAEARKDRRMAWTLGGVWQFQMTDDIWGRVQLFADSYWQRHQSQWPLP